MTQNRAARTLLCALLLLSVILALPACGGGGEETEGAYKTPLALLQAVWSSYGEGEKFAAGGGDSSSENASMDGPGKFGIADTEALDLTLGFPAGSIDKIDDAASLIHMMNANTFTCGAYHLTDPSGGEALADAIEENLQGRQWVCGFPEKLLILRTGDDAGAFVLSVYGDGSLLDTFKSKVSAISPDTAVLCDKPIA